jgi:hypothetical protein
MSGNGAFSREKYPYKAQILLLFMPDFSEIDKRMWNHLAHAIIVILVLVIAVKLVA